MNQGFGQNVDSTGSSSPGLPGPSPLPNSYGGSQGISFGATRMQPAGQDLSFAFTPHHTGQRDQTPSNHSMNADEGTDWSTSNNQTTVRGRNNGQPAERIQALNLSQLQTARPSAHQYSSASSGASSHVSSDIEPDDMGLGLHRSITTLQSVATSAAYLSRFTEALANDISAETGERDGLHAYTKVSPNILSPICRASRKETGEPDAVIKGRIGIGRRRREDQVDDTSAPPSSPQGSADRV